MAFYVVMRISRGFTDGLYVWRLSLTETSEAVEVMYGERGLGVDGISECGGAAGGLVVATEGNALQLSKTYLPSTYF